MGGDGASKPAPDASASGAWRRYGTSFAPRHPGAFGRFRQRADGRAHLVRVPLRRQPNTLCHRLGAGNLGPWEPCPRPGNPTDSPSSPGATLHLGGHGRHLRRDATYKYSPTTLPGVASLTATPMASPAGTATERAPFWTSTRLRRENTINTPRDLSCRDRGTDSSVGLRVCRHQSFDTCADIHRSAVEKSWPDTRGGGEYWTRLVTPISHRAPPIATITSSIPAVDAHDRPADLLADGIVIARMQVDCWRLAD